MIDEFKKYLGAHTSLDDAETDRICSLAVARSLHRNELLLQQGQVCRHKIFVASGLLYTYATAADGSDHILQFSAEQTWTLDAESYDRQIPSQFNIAAIENSQVLCWCKTDFDFLLANTPSLKIFAEQLISRNVHSSRQRILTTLSAAPLEKYESFLKSYPDLLPRLPLRMIASYLGISLKTLTRIRHAQLRR